MVKTTTQNFNPATGSKNQKIKRIRAISPDFTPSDFTLSNILNYSKTLNVLTLRNTSLLLEVMN